MYNDIYIYTNLTTSQIYDNKLAAKSEEFQLEMFLGNPQIKGRIYIPPLNNHTYICVRMRVCVCMFLCVYVLLCVCMHACMY